MKFRFSSNILLLSFILISSISLASAFNFGQGQQTDISIFTGNLTNLSEMQDSNSGTASDGQILSWSVSTGKWEPSSAGAGDILAVNTDGPYLSGGETSGTVNLLVNETYLNETITAIATVFGGNSSFNQSLTDGLYIAQSDEASLNVNSSDYWDGLDTINLTQMENNGGTLNILVSWFTTQWNTIFGTKTTDDLTEGSTNLYDNQSWNESHADTLYADISVTGDNESWNESHANTLYVNIDGDTMTGDLNFSNSGIYNASFISLNTTQSDPAHLEGLIFYDQDALVPSFYTEDPEVKNSLGLEMWKRVRNTGGVQIDDGDAVYIKGSTGQVAEVGLAVSSSSVTAAVIGLATEEIANNDFGWITVLGDVHNLNTSAFSAGDVVYLSETTPGAWTNIAPSAPNFVISIGEITMSHVNQGIISVRPSPTDVLNHMVIQDLSINNNLTVAENITADNLFGNIDADFVQIALGTGSPTVDQLQEYLDNTGSSGFFLGGELSDGGSGTLNVAAGSGFIRATNDDNTELQSFKWSASSGIAVPDDTTQYVYVNYTGTISLSQNEFLEAPDKIKIGVVTDEGATISHTFALGVRLEESVAEAGRFIRRVHGISRDVRRGGLIMGQSGDANRDITMTAGSLWWGRTEYIITSFDTSGADTFATYSASGQESSAASQFPNTQYDNAGTLTTLSNNKWANLFFFLEPDGHVIMIYGRSQFNSEALAENEGVPTTSLPSRVSETSILVSRFTFQESSNTAIISSAFEQLFANAGVTDHGNLAGLADDDHTQYVLADGSRALTSDWDQGAFNLTNTISWFLGKVDWSTIQNVPFSIADFFTKAEILGFNYYNSTDFVIGDYSTTSQANGLYAPISIIGTVTSIAAGNGMDFTTITGTGTATMGTPSTLTSSTTNALTSDSHTHEITESGFSISASQITAGTFGTGNYVIDSNLTVEGIKLEGDPTNHRIYDNSTCTIITGDTSVFAVC